MFKPRDIILNAARSTPTVKSILSERIKQLIQNLTIFILSLLLNPSYAAHTAAENPLEEVTLQLKWRHHFQFAGYYAAIEQGYYREVGLNVTLLEGSPGVDFIDQVVSGRANFGVEMPGLLLSRHEGKKVVVLAAIFQHSPLVLVMRQDSGIETPQDLRGRKVMIRFSSKAELLAMFLNEGIALDEIEFSELSWNVDDLIDGKIDAIHGYSTDQPFSMKQKNIPITIIRPQTYGIDFYGDCLFTSEQEIKNHPQRVKKFREASMHGWAYAMQNQEEIVDLILSKYDPQFSKESMLFEANVINEIMFPDLVEIGHMSRGRWKHIADTFVKLNMLQADYNLDDFIYNPNTGSDLAWLWHLVRLLLAILALISICIAILFTFNRRLSKVVETRTEELSSVNQNLRDEITERKRTQEALHESEEHYRAVVEDTPVLICRFLPGGEITYANQAYCKYFDQTADQLIGRSFTLSIPEAEREEVMNNISTITIDSPNQSHEHQVIGASGDILWTRWINRAQFNAEGQAVIYQSIGEDITKRKIAEEKLKQSQNQLRQSQKMEAVGQLAGGIAHDFNNILQVINGFAELALNKIDKTHPAKSDVEEIAKSGERASALVRQLLAFSRRQVLDMKDVNLNDIVTDLMKMIPRVIGEHIMLDIVADKNLGIVRVDPGQIEQIILNLCVNARDAMPEGGTIRIETANVQIDEAYCETRKWASVGSYALLKVSDSGSGMSEEILNNVFEPFFTTKEIGAGTGLGLSTVYGLVKQHHGMIDVTSEMGKGSSIEIYLPLIEGPITTSSSKITGPAVGGTETILLAEDDEMVCDLAQTILQKAGYTVLTATDGEQAIAEFETNSEIIDIALLDVMMPKLGGQAVYEHIRQTHPDLGVLFASGYSRGAIHSNFQLDKGLQLIQKPYKKDALLQRIRQILDQEKVI